MDQLIESISAIPCQGRHGEHSSRWGPAGLSKGLLVPVLSASLLILQACAGGQGVEEPVSADEHSAQYGEPDENGYADQNDDYSDEYGDETYNNETDGQSSFSAEENEGSQVDPYFDQSNTGDDGEEFAGTESYDPAAEDTDGEEQLFTDDELAAAEQESEVPEPPTVDESPAEEQSAPHMLAVIDYESEDPAEEAVDEPMGMASEPEIEDPSVFAEDDIPQMAESSLEETPSYVDPVANTQPHGDSRNLGYHQYIVQPGDSLGEIARFIFGSAGRWRELARINNLQNPENIFPGDKIHYNPVDKSSQRFASQFGTMDFEKVEVKKGDSLSKLADQIFGDQSLWQLFVAYNPEQIQNPNVIEVGTILNYVRPAKVKKFAGEIHGSDPEKIVAH